VHLYLPLLNHPAHKVKQAVPAQMCRGKYFLLKKYLPIEEISAQVYTKMAATQAAEEFLQKLLAEMSPEDEQYLMQLLAENVPAAGPLHEVVQNILDEPVRQ